MKIHQNERQYTAIEIVLETREEAEALRDLADNLCLCYASEDCDITASSLTNEQKSLALKISNAFTECEVTV